MLATCGQDCTVRLWSCDTFSCLHRIGTHADQVTKSPVACLAAYSAVEFVSVHTDIYLLQVTEILWLGVGNFATGSLDCTAHIHSLEPTGSVRTTQLSGHQGRVTCLARTSDRTTLVTGCTDAHVRVWDLPEGRRRHSLSGAPRRSSSPTRRRLTRA